MNMPRGVKGSGKAKTPTKKQAVVEKPIEESAVKERKPYPTHEERLAMADKKIEQLTKLNADRVLLIEKTEKTLADRKAALDKSEAALEEAKALKERIVERMNRPAKAPAPKLTPEERAERRKEALAKAREAKRAAKEKYDALIAAIEESGKSVDEVLEELKQ